MNIKCYEQQSKSNFQAEFYAMVDPTKRDYLCAKNLAIASYIYIVDNTNIAEATALSSQSNYGIKKCKIDEVKLYPIYFCMIIVSIWFCYVIVNAYCFTQSRIKVTTQLAWYYYAIYKASALRDALKYFKMVRQ